MQIGGAGDAPVVSALGELPMQQGFVPAPEATDGSAEGALTE